MICPLNNCTNSNCPDLAICLSQSRRNNNRGILYNRVAAKQLAEDSNQEFTGVYTGHNCITGENLIKLNSGAIIAAKSISSGHSSSGDSVSAIIPVGSGRAICDKMPRG